MTAEQLGAALGLHPRGRYDFFDALVALGFLDRDGDGQEGRYRNTPETGAFLVKQRPTYICRAWNLEQKLQLIRKAYDALPEGGRSSRSRTSSTMPGARTFSV